MATSIIKPGIQVMTGAGASTAGTSGLVPAPSAGGNTLFLRGDATWSEPPGTKLIVKDLDTVTNESGSYTHTTVLSDITSDMKVIKLELSDPNVFLDAINVTTGDGSITLSCNSVVGTSTVKVSLLFIANANVLTSNEFDILNNRILAVENVCTDTEVTIATTDWTATSNAYSYVWSNSLIEENSLVEILLRDGAEGAGIDEIDYVKSTGSVTIVTTSTPTGSLPITIRIIHTKPNGLQELSATQVASEAITGASTVEEALTALNTQKVSTSNVANNLTTTASGKVLDARQGKILDDKLRMYNNTSISGDPYMSFSVQSDGRYQSTISLGSSNNYRMLEISESGFMRYVKNVNGTVSTLWNNESLLKVKTVTHSISVTGNTAYNADITYTADTGYTPIGVVGYNIPWNHLEVYRLANAIGSAKIWLSVQNTSSTAMSSVTGTFYVLEIKTYIY